MRPVAIFAAYVILLACPVSALTKQYRTYVDPGPAETMQGPCEYELTLRDASKPVKAVFVVVEWTCAIRSPQSICQAITAP